MKVLGIDFGHKKKPGGTVFLLKKALEASKSLGAETEMVRITDYNIMPCKGCGLCMDKKMCPLLDDPKDDAKKLFEKCYSADSFIFAFPVYALMPPGLMINFFDRCPPVDPEDLRYDFYSYASCRTIKGKCYKGKVAGLISNAAAIGHDFALGVFNPMLSALELTVVASAGISLMEYDQMPQFRKLAWSKPIEEADFAIDMVRGVGKRVVTGTKAFRYSEKAFSPFNEKKSPQPTGKVISKAEFTEIIPSASFKLVDDTEVSLDKYKNRINIVLIGKGPTAAPNVNEWFNKFYEIYKDNEAINIIRIAIPGDLPDFITHEFIKEQIKKVTYVESSPILIDWDGTIEKKIAVKYSDLYVSLKVYDKNNKLIYELPEEYSEEGFDKVKTLLMN